MTAGKMDDPVEASFDAWPSDSPHLGERLSNLTLSVAGIKFIPLKLAQILRDQFASGSRFQRIEYLFNALRLGFHRMELEMGEVAEKVKVVNERVEGERFREALSVACEEAARAVNKERIEQMADLLLGYASPTPSEWATHDDDIATMIRDVARLGGQDIEVLRILATVHSAAISYAPNLHDSNQFSKETPNLMRAVGVAKIHRDDFLSTCERLRGFGFVAEVLRNTSHMGPQDFCYRPTRRGLVLLDYLQSRHGTS